MLRHDFKKLQLIRRNKEWLAAEFPLDIKLGYYFSIVAAYFRLIFLRQKYINYFGYKFVYDNIATPLNLQNYPYEITNKILANTKTPIKKILDIGGNIGQFPVTLLHVKPSINRIDVFEPNPIIFEILKRNTENFKKIKIYNYAVAKDPNLIFYFEEGRSATGSFIKENATDATAALTNVKVQAVSNIASITKNSLYDLITVDVEGFEYNVIPLLKNVKTRYLYLEASASGRIKGYTHNALLNKVKEAFGNFDIVYQSELSGNMTTIEYLFEFI